MATIPSLPSREDVLRMARSTTDITGQLLDAAQNITRIAVNTLDPQDGSGVEMLRVLRETTAELPATAGVAAGVLLVLTPVIRAAAEVLRDSSPELRRAADALTAAVAPVMPLQVALAERAAMAGAGVVRAAVPPLADLTEGAAATARTVRPVVVAGEELLVAGLEQLQPLLLAGAARAGRIARAVAVRVSAAVSPAAEPGVVVSVAPV
ncbi:hypothetical protein [Streptomyces sp. HC307]|uniref:hypothetical protein n=1 Tax=Streptomyces flavusporus TaxID=3385496 RepID=UPI003916DE6E